MELLYGMLHKVKSKKRVGCQMNFMTYKTVSEEVRGQLVRVCDIWREHAGGMLLGIYAHGSLALGCFQENVSDLDLLVVTGRRIPRNERLRIAGAVMQADKKPCPLEMSALYSGDINPWHYPTPCQFHYSGYWTEPYRKLLSGEETESFIVDTDFEDPDIACHVRLAKQCGICLYGQPMESLLPDVPEKDFWDSISREVEEYDFHAYEPKYFSSNIIVLGRILSYKEEKKILSKYEAAVWAANHVPEEYRYIIEDAVRVWYLGQPQAEYRKEDLEGLRQYLIGRIKG